MVISTKLPIVKDLIEIITLVQMFSNLKLHVLCPKTPDLFFWSTLLRWTPSAEALRSFISLCNTVCVVTTYRSGRGEASSAYSTELGP